MGGVRGVRSVWCQHLWDKDAHGEQGAGREWMCTGTYVDRVCGSRPGTASVPPACAAVGGCGEVGGVAVKQEGVVCWRERFGAQNRRWPPRCSHQKKK